MYSNARNIYVQDYQDESLVSNKQFKSKDLELQHLVKSVENIEIEYKSFNSNISKDEQEALQKLITNKDIIVKSTDKGGDLVLMDKKYYCDHLVNKEHRVKYTKRFQQIQTKKFTDSYFY